MLQPDTGRGLPRSPPPCLDRRGEVMTALDAVMDPELDAAVTEMGFVEGVAIEGGRVAVDFRLPTFWCSANFAFLMASDMKVAIEALDWVEEARIHLVDHFAAGKINRGVAAGRTFADIFDCPAGSGLDDIRRVFREKAFLGRQERLLRHLAGTLRAEGGLAIESALAMTIADLRGLTRSADAEVAALAIRYLGARLGEAGGTADGSPAFTTSAGEAVAPAAYATHLRAIRSVRGAAEANAEMCRIYLEARYAGAAPGSGTVLDRRHDDE